MKKDVKLYNVLFPVWILVTLPFIWWIVIPGNFLIDSLVLYFAAKKLKVEEPKMLYKRHILPVFFFGFLSDILASIPMWGGVYLEIGGPLADSPVLTVPGVLLAAGLIYLFNYGITFRKLEKPLRKKLSQILAIATAPYTFLIPSTWIY